jgi:hypothetical protein
VRGLQSAFTGGGVESVIRPVSILLASTALVTVIAVILFRPNEKKVSWS